MPKRPFALMTAIALCTGGAVAQSGSKQPFTIVESGRGFATLQRAINAIGDGNGTIAIRPGSYDQCAHQERGTVRYRAALPGSVLFNPEKCNNGIILAITGNAADIDGINFTISGQGGTAIHIGKGDLRISRSIFRNSDRAITTGDDPTGSIRIDRSSFSETGGCVRGRACFSSIDVGQYRLFQLTHSRFDHGRGGHYVRSGAMRVRIISNGFDDSKGRDNLSMINLPYGAGGRILDNIFVQGRALDRRGIFISLAGERRRNSSRGLVIRGNDASIAPAFDRTATFLADWSGEGVRPAGNRLGRKLTPYEQRRYKRK